MFSTSNFLHFCVLVSAVLGANNVNVRLNTNWKETSILAEISEYMANESNEKFWMFVSNVNEEVTKADDEEWNDKTKYDIGVSIATKIIGPLDIDIMKVSISIRKLSPLVQVHQQIGAKIRFDSCPAFVIYKDQVKCRLDELDLDAIDGKDDEIFAFDHVYPLKASNKSKTLFLYGDIGSKEFATLINTSQTIVDSSDNIRMIVRHFRNTENLTYVSLSGYGVELSLKNTEYKISDDKKDITDLPKDLKGLNFQTLNAKHPDKQDKLESLLNSLENGEKVASLKSWELKDLGYQLCWKIVEESKKDNVDILETIETYTQNFLSHTSKNFRYAIRDASMFVRRIGTPDVNNILLINGAPVNAGSEEILDVFALVDTLKNEKKLIEDMNGIGFNDTDKIVKMLSFADYDLEQRERSTYDYRKADPIYTNDVEKVGGRAQKNLNNMLSFFHGFIRPIARNIFTLVVFFDPFSKDVKVLEQLQAIANRERYIRYALVPIYNEQIDGKTLDEVIAIGDWRYEEYSRFFENDDDLKEHVLKGNEFLESTGISIKPTVLLNGYQLKMTASNEYIEGYQMEILRQTQVLQQALQDEEVDNDVKIEDWWIRHSVKRENHMIIEAFKTKKFIELDQETMNIVDKWEGISKTQDNKHPLVTNWIITDLETEEGRKFAIERLKETRSEMKNIVVPNPLSGGCAMNSITYRFLYAYETSTINELVKILDDFVETSGKFELPNIVPNKHNPCDKSTFKYALRAAGLQPGESAIVSNGLIFGPIDLKKNNNYMKQDMELIWNIWMDLTWKVAAQLGKNQKKLELEHDLNMRFYSLLGRALKQSKNREDLGSAFRKENFLTIPPKYPSSPFVDVTWVLNPLTREAQHLSSIVRVIRDVLNCRVRILFHPTDEVQQLPVQRFYRFVVNKEIGFDENGKIDDNFAVFNDLPKEELFTMNIETNDPWLIEAKQAKHDLDNIRMDKISEDVSAVFSLENILFIGGCLKNEGVEASGVELEFKSDGIVYDTIVIHTLGYYQLKANPGIWNIMLRKGESTKNYEMKTLNDKNVNESNSVVVDSFSGKWNQIHVSQRIIDPVDTDKLISETTEKSMLSGWMETIGNLISGDDEKDVAVETFDQKVINVFSLASGHMYERLIRIMMLSVIKTTKESRVKFWLLKNYHSPTFKETLPKMARLYGFDYEFVQYKWPKWLNRQTQKQRIMWGYKILFLDVMFPLSLDKVIFVDADQVVRSDLQQLIDYPLDNAPYGYVPFCSSRKETAGYQFWSSGWWEGHLRGRPYHISALFVVDLKKFRELQAGDRLRVLYHVLTTSDPNNLANLDQDLPNHMIHEVPIKSLPQEWLWCETWCDDKSKEKAKTIDLCNNPLTKESKLAAAARIIPEWTTYDTELEKKLGSADNIAPKTEL